MTRVLVAALGVFTIAVGILQVWTPKRAIQATHLVMGSEYLTAIGLLGLVIGLAFVQAGLRRMVRIPLYVTIFGALLFLGGAMALAHPASTRHFVERMFFHRSTAYQTTATFAGGCLRVILGALLVYAGVMPPQASRPAATGRTEPAKSSEPTPHIEEPKQPEPPEPDAGSAQ